MKRLPPEKLDWVSVRKACSLANAFNELRADVQQNIEQVNKESDFFQFGTRDNTFHITRKPRTQFDEPKSVRFSLRRQNISVEGHGCPPFTLTLTLNEFGDCRFKCGEDELVHWQVLRKALETLFFEPAEED